jgi:alanine dehydrogenase
MLKDKWKKETDRFRIIAPFELEEKTLRDADVFIGCAHRPGQRADHVISMEGLQRTGLQKKKILMDVAIDQGGNFPDSHVTSYEDPLYLDASGNLRFSVTNIPSLCGKGASEAVTKVTLPYTLAMAKNFEKALQEFPELEKAINISGGRIVHPAVKEAHVF